jgi:adenylate cyclase
MSNAFHGLGKGAIRIAAHVHAFGYSDEAAAKLHLAMQDQPSSPPTYRFLAACYAHTGRFDEARAILARLRAIAPLVAPSGLPYRNPEDRELFLSGLRLAIGDSVT